MSGRGYTDPFHDPNRYKARHAYSGRDLGHVLRGGRYDGGFSEDAPYGGTSLSHEPGSSDPGFKHRKKKGHPIRNVVLLLFVIAVVVFAFFCFQVDSRLHDFPTEEQLALDERLSPSAIMGVQPVNILLLGSDARADDPALGARTDAIVLCRVDSLAKTVNMVSIPRDTMIDIPGYGTNKINAAYAFAGASGAVDAVEALCDIKVDHCAVVDFSGLCRLVDDIGGIDVFLDEPIDNPKAGDATLEAGQQHINGAQALVMSRDRDYADGDYTRQLNQRKVISGIVKRILELPPQEMPAAFSGVAECVSCDSGTGTAGLVLLLLRLKAPWGEMKMAMTGLPSQPAYVDDVSYVVADRAATADLMRRLEDGGDIQAESPVSSIYDDIAAVGGY